LWGFVKLLEGRGRKRWEKGSTLTCGPRFVLVVTGDLLTAEAAGFRNRAYMAVLRGIAE